MNKRVLITGGCGFIGSHTALELAQAGYEVFILDNLCNSDASVLGVLRDLGQAEFPFIQADVRDTGAVADALKSCAVASVIHFAGLKSVGESSADPLDYFDNNVGGTTSLLKAMRLAGVRHLVFSSSATVYGDAEFSPIPETASPSVTNPYGRSKLIVEQMLGDISAGEHPVRSAILRYFNPAGAHPSGRIGERPRGKPNNLMPYVAQVAAGQRPRLSVFGGDYETRDGTGVRDYIHVMDLARGHIAALDHLLACDAGFTVNLGTGTGYSVLEVIAAFEKASGVSVPYDVASRRPGDVASNFADAGLAFKMLGWKAEKTLADMCADSWRWQRWLADNETAQLPETPSSLS